MAENNTTISFKVPTALFEQIKRVSKARGISMSKLIRNAIEKQFLKPTGSKEPEWFKYLGKFEIDNDLKEYNQSLNAK